MTARGPVGLAAYRPRRQGAYRPAYLAPADYRALVRSVPCPSCSAATADRCVNHLTGLPLREEIPGHHARARAAVHTADDTQEGSAP